MRKQEEWRDVVGYEGVYQVSNIGNVRSMARVMVYKNGQENTHKGRVLRSRQMTTGYPAVSLSTPTSGIKLKSIHRLLAMAFIENKDNKRCVNHKDGDKLNNCIENLEWCTYSENNQHAYDVLGKKPTWLGVRGIDHPLSKPIQQLLGDVVIKQFDSARDAAEELGIQYKNISAVCRGKRNMCGGFGWRFV